MSILFNFIHQRRKPLVLYLLSTKFPFTEYNILSICRNWFYVDEDMIFIKDIIKWLHYKLNHQNTSCYISKLKFATAMAHCQTHGNTITSVFWSSRRRKPMHCNGWYENTWEYSWGLPLPYRSEWGGAKGSWLLSTFFAYIFYSLYILDQERLKSIAIINVSLIAHVLEVSNALNWCPRQEEAKWQNCIEVTGNILVS